MGNWTKEKSRERIHTRIDEVADVTVKDYVRDTDLASLPTGTAYRVDGTHIYIDVLNFKDILSTTEKDGPQAQKRALRFLNLHFRAVHRILDEEDVIEVDFANQRLHAVIVKPYDDEAARVHKAVAVAQLIADVLNHTGDSDESIPNARLRVGIDTGVALAVNNGRRGHREPLFLGRPANMAAKYAAGTDSGIYLTPEARAAIDLPSVTKPKETRLTVDEITVSETEADLYLIAEKVIADWEEELEDMPIGTFEFKRHTPPFANLDLETLSAANSRRQEAISIYADIDGFTDFVAQNIDDGDSAEDVVRVLHVLRSELHAVLVDDFEGVKVRFIGDCIHGLLVEGTAQNTDVENTIRMSALCAGGLRSGFDLALEILAEEYGVDLDSIGLAIGFEFGPIAITRLGVKGSLIRAAIGRSVLSSEEHQKVCEGHQTAVGAEAHANGAQNIRTLFGNGRIANNLTYDKAETALKAVKTAESGNSLLRPATVASAAPLGFTQNPLAPTKPAEFGAPKKPTEFA